MTTLTINIPDSNKRVISDITNIVSNAGYELLVNNDDDFRKEALFVLIDAYKEALLIKDGKAKAIPASELWND